MSETATAPAEDVRRWLIQHHSGALGTVHSGEGMEGWPFLSVVPFALDARGQPLLQLAGIAQHTRNAKADPRVSLLVQDPSTQGDPQRGWRVTLLGTLAPVEAAEQEEVLARFSERVPAALEYARQHDFAFYRLTPTRVRYIAGFGRICWVDAKDVLREPLGAGLVDAAAGAVAHMNADHGSTLLEICQGLHGFTPAQAEMVALDRTGFLVRTKGPERLVHCSFGREIDAGTLRQEVIGVLKRARPVRAGGAAGSPAALGTALCARSAGALRRQAPPPLASSVAPSGA